MKKNGVVKQFLIEKCFVFDANQRSSFKVRKTSTLNKKIQLNSFKSIIHKNKFLFKIHKKKEIVKYLENVEKNDSTKESNC